MFCLGGCGNLTFALSLLEEGKERKHQRAHTFAALLNDVTSVSSQGFQERRPDIFRTMPSPLCHR